MKPTSSFDPEKSLQLAMSLFRNGHFAQAGGQLTRVLRQDPDSLQALQLMGVVASELGKHAQALQHLRRAAQIDPMSPSVHMNLATALERERSLDQATAVLLGALQRGVKLPPLVVLPLVAGWQQDVCDWRDYDERLASLRRLLSSANTKVEGVAHYSLFYWDDPVMHRRCADLELGPALPKPQPRGHVASAEGRRIKVAYLSADFRRHPTSRLIPGVLEAHDRARYEVIAVSLNPPDGSRERARIEQAVDVFLDLHDRTSEQIAAILRKRRVDIAVDLMGHTKHSRPDIHFHRAAPVQVNYLGFPGTSGMRPLDYMIVDPFLAAAEFQRTASEQLVILPDCYQSNDDKRARPNGTPGRTELGLPEGCFIFASFNDVRKITPETFDVWMRILRQVDGSVLWLLGRSEAADSNLREEATRRGIDPARLIFAQRMDADAHLTRIRAADLVLDTFPCGAHSTGSDVLWAGRPILTMAGKGFPSRVCGSLLTAIGAPDLITASWADYEALAIRLARDRQFLDELTERVASGRTSSPLFDTQRLTRNLERAYEAMVALSSAGNAPALIDLRRQAPAAVAP